MNILIFLYLALIWYQIKRSFILGENFSHLIKTWKTDHRLIRILYRKGSVAYSTLILRSSPNIVHLIKCLIYIDDYLIELTTFDFNAVRFGLKPITVNKCGKLWLQRKLENTHNTHDTCIRTYAATFVWPNSIFYFPSLSVPN